MIETVAGTSETSKRKPAKRKFNKDWECLFFVTAHNDKTFCLLCRLEFSDNKKYSVERHFHNNHNEIDAKFPLQSDKRSQEILRLKYCLVSEQKVVKKYVETNELVTCASFQISYTLAKNGKAYSDGEMYKNLLQSSIETLCTNLEEKTKSYLLNNVKMLQLSHQTVCRRVIDIGDEIESQLKINLKNCTAFSLALDETTDVCHTSQLVFWVRYDLNGAFREDILALIPTGLTTRGLDVLNALKEVCSRFELDLKKLVSVATDGAPSMVGKTNGFVKLLKDYLKEIGAQKELISYHCIIHQQNLCAKALGKDDNVLPTITKVVFFAY